MRNALDKLFPKEYRSLALTFIATRATLFMIMGYSQYVAGRFSEITNFRQVLNMFVNWDGGWYMHIIQNGYSATPIAEEQANYAFFPLYPMLVRFTGDTFGGEYVLIGVLLSNIFTLIGILYFYKLSERIFLSRKNDAKKLAFSSTLLLICFPTAFLFTAVLSEALFFMLLTMSFYYATQHKIVITTILGFLTSMTRSVGFLVLIPVLYEFWFKNGLELNPKKFYKNFDYRTILLFTIPLGMVAFAYYIYRLTSDPLAIFEIQGAWGRHLTNPIAVTHFILRESYLVKFGAIFTVGIFFVILSGLRKIRIDYFVFALLLFLIPLMSSPLPFHISSLPRYILVILPIYWIFAIYLDKYKDLKLPFLISSVMLQGFLASLWTLGYGVII